ncbi:GNAT family N-acetyltransferase [Yokenella regensburgei]|uniref:GNAT family N-acetyltransferase n=1 Tax=Yokenella regensburgei TaxID=158877 RepID=UPI003ED9F6BC
MNLETHTDRLVLRPFKPEDTIALHTLAGNPELAKWTQSFSIPFTLQKAEEWISRAIDQTANKTNITFSLHLKDNDELVGAASFRLTGDQEAELGYWLGVEFQGKGYCVEAVREVIRFALVSFHVKRIVGRCAADNQASVKVMARCGMQPVKEDDGTLLIKQNLVQLLTFDLACDGLFYQKRMEQESHREA